MAVRIAVEQVLDAVRFLSRLPLPEAPLPPRPLAITLRAAPLAGLLIAALPALVLWLSARGGLPDLAAAALAATVAMLVTGGLHEDGLADVADGFWGGASVSRKLAIMRDSRIGTFGTLAIVAAFVLRVAALQALLIHAGPGAAALALLAAASLSRGLMLIPLALLPPARSDGLARAAGPDGQPMLAAALVTSSLLAALLAVPAAGDGLRVLAGLLASAAAALALTHLARHHIRGVTGDVIGATQQVSEIVYLLMLCATAGSR